MLMQRPNNQSGAVFLIMAVLLLFVASLGAFSIGRVSQVELRLAGNALRSREVYAAANGAMGYAEHWLRKNFLELTWSDMDGNGDAAPGDTATPTPLPVLALTADSYSRSVIYQLRSEINPVLTSVPRIIDISVTARATTDSHVAKTLHSSVILFTLDILSSSTLQGSRYSNPPLLVEHCFQKPLPAGNVFPLRGISVGTSNGDVNEACLDPGGLNLHGGVRVSPSSSNSLWESVFAHNMTEKSLLEMQEVMPQRIFIVDANYPSDPKQPSYSFYWNSDVGSSSAPVLLYFSQGFCPKIQSGTVVWGLVYYADPDCGVHEIGGGEIHGTLAKTGDLNRLTANTLIVGADFEKGSASGGTRIEIGFSLPRFFSVPGSWRDF